MGEHNPFAYSGGSAGIDERPNFIPGSFIRNRRIRVLSNEVEKFIYPRGRLDLAIHVLLDKWEELFFGKRQVVVYMTGNDAFDLCLWQYLECPGKQQVQGDENLCITIVQLVLQLPL